MEMLRRASARNRLSHGYLFLGPEGIGKRTLARGLAQALFCREHAEAELAACGHCPSCRQVVAGTHPDLFEIGCPEGKRELPIDLIVGAKERRGREGLCHDISLRPMESDRRIAIIDDAHTMNEESANALLKTLEEPPEGSILILIAPEIEPLLPTIRSRCQPLWFSPLPVEIVESILTGEGVEPGVAQAAARLCDGSPALARALLDPTLAQIRKTVEAGLKQSPMNPLAMSAAVMESVEASASDTAGQRESAQWAIRFAADYFRKTLGGELSADAAEFRTCDRAAVSLMRCLDAVGQLHQSMPVPLCLAGLFDDLGRISRTGLPVAL